jgi:hypothetical protein
MATTSTRTLAVLLGSLALGACGSGASSSGNGSEPTDASPPLEPGKGDSAESAGYVIEGARTWSLIGNALTPGDDHYDITVTGPAKAHYVDVWIDSVHTHLHKSGNVFSASIDVSILPFGKHRVLFAANGAKTAFAARDLIRTHPLYVFVSNDWDDPDNEDPTLERQERLHAEHPELVLTHFVGPYTFTDPEIAPERVELLTNWVKQQRATHGDEVGLHIHPYCSFVESAGVSCRTQPSFAKAYGDPTGYTVILSSYEKSELDTLLHRADELFADHGLGKPTSFRAGGWTAETHVLQALADDGFVADGSAANWQYMEEWKDVWGASIYPWCKQHWSQIDDQSQPYFPSIADIQSAGSPFVPLLEIPDNGLLVDYVEAQEMIGVFQHNWSGGALDTPRVVSIGYHPPNFSEKFFARIDGALDEMDQHLASADQGPVVYATASGLAKVWPVPTE